VSSKKDIEDVEKQFKKIRGLKAGYTEPKIPLKPYLIDRKRKALLRKIKAAIKDEEKAAKKYFDLQTEVRLIDKEIANDLYRISGEQFTHKTTLEQIYKKLGGELK